MKIGIITFHQANNFGAVLQCFALQEYLKTLNHNVEIIDYIQPNIEKLYSAKFSILSFVKAFLRFNLSAYLKLIKSKRTKQNNFNNFRSKYLNLSKPFIGRNIPQNYDLYIVGSDQMWSYQCVHCFEQVYWGCFKHSDNSKIIGFSISGNGDFTNRIDNETVIQSINNFANISFREPLLQSLVQQITGKKFPVTIDPTLLLDQVFWNPIVNENWCNKGLVVVYQVRSVHKYGNRIRQIADNIATSHNKEVLVLNNEYCVEDFVSAIKYASCVITTSFHATAFSLIFGTPFYSIRLNDGHDDRYVNLLKELRLEKHILEINTDVSDPLQINKNSLQNKLCQLRHSSIEYLNNVL